MFLHGFNNERKVDIEHTLTGLPDITAAIDVAKCVFLTNVRRTESM
jgi:hypothetical protein